MIIACCFRVAALSGHAALALTSSDIAHKLNRIQLSAICRGGQSGKVIDLLARRCLVIPLRQVTLAQLYKYHHQSSNGASGKLVSKQHHADWGMNMWKIYKASSGVGLLCWLLSMSQLEEV